ncbi:MAG: phosphoribosylanthranilate isomerase [Saprospiraceae bacterium]|uniref:N-(5'-phosphoribosyl)anthranilate isomerase n=1 Tax=Candidatus Opimibacter skivensis TaxID=2982028 RepID=A0A9D7T083_9BACT|nr:phosphoribosylanthranilate isomerase [Candidatus Opimibacter skivensis]
MSTRIKICCISSSEEAMLAINYGANALGLVGPMPSGPGPISVSLIREIAQNVHPGVSTFLLTSETTADGIIRMYNQTHTQVLQLVDAVEDVNVYLKLREALPHVKLVQVIHVTGEESLDEAILLAPYTDALLLDSGNPKLAVKELGGTGRVHDWKVSRAIVEQCGKPVFLAGGLNPSNVREAIDHVNPFGVDICSGLRRNGKLDEGLVEKFVKMIR